jgi:hypothetical protein
MNASSMAAQVSLPAQHFPAHQTAGLPRVDLVVGVQCGLMLENFPTGGALEIGGFIAVRRREPR